jgi:hypothetical protein
MVSMPLDVSNQGILAQGTCNEIASELITVDVEIKETNFFF